MRKQKVIIIGGRSITVKEMKTSDVISLLEDAEGMRICIGLMTGMPSDIKKVMPLSLDLSPEELEEITEGINSFSTLEGAFREVNADFFDSLAARIETITTAGAAAVKKLGLSLSGPAGSSRKGTPAP